MFSILSWLPPVHEPHIPGQNPNSENPPPQATGFPAQSWMHETRVTADQLLAEGRSRKLKHILETAAFSYGKTVTIP
jgi:hypothetical protein